MTFKPPTNVFLGRFQLLPQHCPAALNLGFKFIVRYVHYHPNFPFTINQGAFPFKEEGQAKEFVERKIESAYKRFFPIHRGKPWALREIYG